MRQKKIKRTRFIRKPPTRELPKTIFRKVLQSGEGGAVKGQGKKRGADFE